MTTKTIEQILNGCAEIMQWAQVGKVSQDNNGAYLDVATEHYRFQLCVRIRVKLVNGKPAIQVEPLFHVHSADARSAEQLSELVLAQQRVLGAMATIQTYLSGDYTITA